MLTSHHEFTHRNNISQVDDEENDAVSAVDNAYAVDLFLTAIHAIVEREDLSAVAKGDSR